MKDKLIINASPAQVYAGIWATRREQERQHKDIIQMLKARGREQKTALVSLAAKRTPIPRENLEEIFDNLNEEGEHNISISTQDLDELLSDLKPLKKLWGVRIDSSSTRGKGHIRLFM